MEQLVPKIRFPEFNKDEDANRFKKYHFEDIFNFSTGKNIKQKEASPEYDIPCVRYGELYHMYNEVINEIINKTNIDKSELLFSEGNEILLPSAGEDPLDIGSASALTIKNVAIGRTINILKPKFENIYSQIFASYYINHRLKKEIASLANGVSISNVYNSDLKKLKIILPNLLEQQKIASFLIAIDNLIELLEKQKEQLSLYKKGVSQQLFSQELRFKDDNGNFFPKWEEKKLCEALVFEQPTKYLVSDVKYNNNYPTPVLTAGKTFILGYTNESENIFNFNLPVIIFDDFTTATQFVNFPFKAKSSAMKILLPRENVNIKFVYEAMQTVKFEVGGHGRHWISKYSQISIKFPSVKEQQKIATFLSAIDLQIQQVTKQIEKSKDFKKGLLQQMFV